MQEIIEQIRALSDADNAVFLSRLLPHIPQEQILGCRTPQLRALAKSLGTESDAVQGFLNTLPHFYFDENQLHAFLISRIRSFSECIAAVEAFLPYVDNWATCDQLSPTVFRKETEKLLPYIDVWMQSSQTYTLRFAIGMQMRYFLDERFDAAQPERITAIRSDEYYVNMEIAWYFATALAKQPAAIMPYLEQRHLPEWVHKKTIQKCIESRRIPDETKTYLRTLR